MKKSTHPEFPKAPPPPPLFYRDGKRVEREKPAKPVPLPPTVFELPKPKPVSGWAIAASLILPACVVAGAVFTAAAVAAFGFALALIAALAK